MKKDSKNLSLSDLSKEEQILFLGAELIKLKDLLMVTLDQMNRLNSYRNILSDILEETGIISHVELDKLDNDFNREEMLDVFDCAKMILKNISSPGNLAVEDLVFRRLAGDF